MLQDSGNTSNHEIVLELDRNKEFICCYQKHREEKGTFQYLNCTMIYNEVQRFIGNIDRSE